MGRSSNPAPNLAAAGLALAPYGGVPASGPVPGYGRVSVVLEKRRNVVEIVVDYVGVLRCPLRRAVDMAASCSSRVRLHGVRASCGATARSAIAAPSCSVALFSGLCVSGRCRGTR